MRSVWRGAAPFVLGALLGLVLLFGGGLALAQLTDPSRPGLSAVQPRVQVSLVPGAAAEGEVRFTYAGVTPTSGRVSVLEYRIGPEGETTSPPGEGAAAWITANPTTVELSPNVPTTVRYRIQVPPGAPAGDHSALIVVEADPSAGAGLRTGVRLTVNVPGEIRRQADLVAFGAERQPLRLLGFQAPSRLPLYDGGPIQLRAEIRDSGNVQLNTSGAIRVVDLFGNEVAAFDLPAETIYPGDTRTFTVQWTYPPRIGWFAANLSLDAGGTPMSASERLLVLPWQAVLGAVLVVLFLRLLLGRGFALPTRPARPVAVATAGQAVASPARVASADVDIEPGPRAASQPPAEDRTVADLTAAWVAKGNQDGAPLPRPAEDEAVLPSPLADEAAPPEAPDDVAALAERPAPVANAEPVTNGVGAQADVLELLRLGQQAARTGDRETAYGFFVRALKIDPDNEEAWLWRAGTSEHPREAIRSLEQVLLINPNNLRARQGLEELQRRFAPSQG